MRGDLPWRIDGTIQMPDAHELTGEELQWLLAISRGPLSREAADRRVPSRVRDALIAKGLARWKLGSFEITPGGEMSVARRRAARASAS
ncbi:MAG TPA: hypothetical protein VGD41_19135 [Pyrinomonadaceae bacterium]